MGRSSGQGPGAKNRQGGWAVLAPVAQALSLSERFFAAPGESGAQGGAGPPSPGRCVGTVMRVLVVTGGSAVA